MSDNPILMQWAGDGFVPASRYWAATADKEFVVGERYIVQVQHERSAASHRAYFAAVNECWQNLPDDFAERFPTPDALRRHALIRCGYRNERTFVASSKAEARRIAAFLRGAGDAVLSVNDCVVVEWTAESQSYRAMGRKRFEESKTAVLDHLASLIGISPASLQQARAA